MNTRRNFLTSGAALGGAAFLSVPILGQQSNSDSSHPLKTSDALFLATQSSIADTFNRLAGDRFAYIASATASIRLMAAMFENQNEVGDSTREQSYLLAHLDQVRDFEPTPGVISALQSQMEVMGVKTTAEVLYRRLSLTSSQKDDCTQILQTVGLVRFYRSVMEEVAKSVLGVENAPLGVNYRPTRRPHLKHIRLDSTSCQIIAYGVLFGTLTANPATVFLAVWGIAECT